MPTIKQRSEELELRDAIRKTVDPDRWAALLKAVGGNENDALRALSGQVTGRLQLTEEIASKSLYAQHERNKFRAFERIRDEIIGAFDARRQENMELKGFPITSPGRAVKIPRSLPLTYDFVDGSASSDELRFHGVVARVDTNKTGDNEPPPRVLPVSESELETFSKEYLKGKSPVPSMDDLWKAAQQAFAGKQVSRARTRKMHRDILPASSRKSGPRK